MIEIKLSGGDFDGSKVRVSEEMYYSGRLEVFARHAFNIEVDVMSGEYDPRRLTYRMSLTNPNIWEIVE